MWGEKKNNYRKVSNVHLVFYIQFSVTMNYFFLLSVLSVFVYLFICVFYVFAEDKTREASQEQEKKPLAQPNLCNEDRCTGRRSVQEAEKSTTPPELPAFFSLEALAEVAAMENVHR